MKQEYKGYYEAFGQNVALYRRRKRLTQVMLAQLVDVARSHIAAVEQGKVGVSLDMISSSVKRWTSPPNSCLISASENFPAPPIGGAFCYANCIFLRFVLS